MESETQILAPKSSTPSSPDLDLESSLAQFSLYMQDHDHEPRTTATYQDCIRRFFMWLQTEVGTQSPLPRDVGQYKRQLLIDGKGPSTVNQALAALRTYRAFQLSVDPQTPDWTLGIKFLTVQVAPKWGLQKREYHQIMRLVEGGSPRDKAVFALLLGCGLRKDESTHVLLADVHLTPALRAPHGTLWVRRGKGLRTREVPFGGWVYDFLFQAVQWRKSLGAEDRDPLLGIGVSGVRRAVEKYGEKAKIGLHCHLLRRTYGQAMRKKGFSIEAVSRFLGHSSIDTTQIYTATPDGKFDECPDFE